MADTGSRNFRCADALWDSCMAKAKRMRDEGYDIDVTKVLVSALDEFQGDTIGTTAERLGLTKGDAPAKLYRRPTPRMATGGTSV